MGLEWKSRFGGDGFVSFFPSWIGVDVRLSERLSERFGGVGIVRVEEIHA